MSIVVDWSIANITCVIHKSFEIDQKCPEYISGLLTGFSCQLMLKLAIETLKVSVHYDVYYIMLWCNDTISATVASHVGNAISFTHAG